MSHKVTKNQEPTSYQALLDENRALKNENHSLQDEVESLRARLEEAEELKRAISEGDLDALVMPAPEGELIFTLDSADRAYRVLVETMNEGTATLAYDGTILYCNRHFAELLRMPLQTIVGTSIYRFIAPENTNTFKALLKREISKGEINLLAEESTFLPVYLSISSLKAEGSPNAWCLVVTDLTEQKKNEEILASERLARSIIEQAAEAIVVCDTSGRIIRFSDSIVKLCECDPTFQQFEDLINLRFSEGANAGERILPVSSALRGSTILGVGATFELDCQKLHFLLNSGPLKNADDEIIGCVVTLTDIIELKEAEEALRESEARLQVIIAHSPDIIFEQDRDLRYIWIFNQASPLSVSDVLSKTEADLLPPDQAQQLESIKRRVLDKGMREQAILQLALGGEPRWYEAIYEPRYNEAGQVIGVLSYTRDITKRKQVEDALREAYENLQVQSEELQAQAEELQEANEALSESEKRYRLIFDNSMDAIILTDPQGAGKVLSANPAACRLLGWSEEELIGKERDVIFGSESPVVSAFLDERACSGSAKVQITYRRKDGTILIGELNSTLFTDINREPRSVTIIRDITERKRAEEALRKSEYQMARAQEIARMGSWEVDVKTNVVTGSRELYEIWELDPESWGMDTFTGKIHPDDRQHNNDNINAAIYGHKPYDEEFRVLTSKGERIIHSTGKTIYNEYNRPITFFGIVQDITKRKRAEEAMRESEEIARQRLVEIENLYRHAPVGLCELDRELRYVRVNELMAEINGFPAAAHIGKRIRDVVPQLADAAEPEMLLVLETGEPRIDIEIVGETLSQPGVKRSWLERWLPITDAQGLITGLNIVVVETTERKQAEEALRESEERFRTMANAIPQLAWIAKADGYIYWYNERWYAYTGTTPEQMEGWGWQSVHDPALLPKVLEQWKASIASGQEFDMEFPLRGADGLYRQFLTLGFPLKDAKGQVLQWFGTNTDITERKRREEIKEVVNSINQTIHSTLDFDEIMQKTVSEANKVIGSDTAAISLRKGGRWIVSYVHGFPEDIIGAEMNDEEEPHAVLAIKTRKLVVINDTFNDERVNRNHMKKWGIRSVLVVPIITRDQVIGVICFNCHESIFAFDDIHVDFATRLSSSLSLALENSRLFKKLETELIERKKAENELREAYEKIHKQSQELQVFNEELQVQSEELHEANEALQKSEKRFRTLAENSPDVITRFDRQNRHIYANPAASEAYGFSQEEIIGKTHGELGRNPELVKFLETYQEIVFTTGKPEAMEFHYKSPQGEKYYFNTKIVPEFVNGKVTSVLAISRDIKDIKEAEAKLKETLENLEEKVKERTSELEEAYESLMENEIKLNEAQKIAHLGSWDRDLLTNKLYLSDETYRIFGLDPLQFGETYDSFLNYVHPDDRDYVHNAAKKALNGEPYSIDYRITSRDGDERIVHSQGETIFDVKHIPVRIRGIVQDITERKRMEDALRQSEALLSAFLEQLPVGIGLADTQGHWLVVNSVLRRFVHGFIPSRDPENSWRWRAWRADGRLLKQSEWPSTRALRGESVTPGLDFLYTFDEGREIWMHVTAVPFRNEAGEIRGVITVMQDIDEQKRTEEALEKINKTRIKEIHHRIKNNLQVISSLLSLEAEKFTDTKTLEAFRESQNRVTSMALIHEELYKGTGTDNLDFAAYLRKLTEDLFRSYKLGNKDISLKLDLEQVYLGMDTAIPLGIIVNELVSNSLKHAFSAVRRGEIRINLSKCEISTSIDNISDPDGDCPDRDDFHYMLTVADNGNGIPEEIDFQNTDSLGLQLVNILVDQIDGSIELNRDKGAKFVISFSNIEE